MQNDVMIKIFKKYTDVFQKFKEKNSKVGNVSAFHVEEVKPTFPNGIMFCKTLFTKFFLSVDTQKTDFNPEETNLFPSF